MLEGTDIRIASEAFPSLRGVPMTLCVPAQEYRRKAIQNLFGGQLRGGISATTNHPVIFVFMEESGHEFGSKDGWKGEFFLCAGES